jgi:hypothetical protein
MSAETTELGTRLLWTALIFLALALIYFAMWRSWRRVGTHQTPVSALPEGWNASLCVVGIYASTTRAGRWMERLRGGDLGARSNAEVCVGKHGIWIERQNASSLFISKGQVKDVSLAPGIAGKVVGGRGVLVITWMLGELKVDTGVLITNQSDRAALFAAASELTHD